MSAFIPTPSKRRDNRNDNFLCTWNDTAAESEQGFRRGYEHGYRDAYREILMGTSLDATIAHCDEVVRPWRFARQMARETPPAPPSERRRAD